MLGISILKNPDCALEAVLYVVDVIEAGVNVCLHVTDLRPHFAPRVVGEVHNDLEADLPEVSNTGMTKLMFRQSVSGTLGISILKNPDCALEAVLYVVDVIEAGVNVCLHVTDLRPHFAPRVVGEVPNHLEADLPEVSIRE